MKKIIIDEVSQQEFANLQSYLKDHFDVSFSDLKTGGSTASGRGVSGTIRHDPSSKQLSIAIEATPSIVTTGYILGFLYDHLHVQQANNHKEGK